uniref:Uncharacterized protein n=1 Tax=Picea glauca TaxID=3330 RepID=A0A101M0H8_PICGL|nr:hypothetical protein ABT39_MTgene4717 [Picea glauca]
MHYRFVRSFIFSPFRGLTYSFLPELDDSNDKRRMCEDPLMMNHECY